MASPTPEVDPPYYILLSQSQLPAYPSAGPGTTTLVHPVVQYHYADDPPQALLPRTGESVILIDWDPPSPHSVPKAESFHGRLAVTGVKVSDAPGANVADKEERTKRNDKMFVIETIDASDEVLTDDSVNELDNPNVTVALFRERNELLNKVLD